MLRFTGCALILGGGFLLRCELLRQPTQEVHTLLSLAAGLRLLEQEVALTLLPLPKLLLRVRCAFFQAVYKRVESGRSLADGWAAAAQELSVPQEVKTRIAALGAQLLGEEKTVRETLLHMAELLEREAEQRRSALNERQRLTTTLCISGGALACVLLL